MTYIKLLTITSATALDCRELDTAIDSALSTAAGTGITIQSNPSVESFECKSGVCIFNPEGICLIPIRTGKPPAILDADGCLNCISAEGF